MLSSKRDKEEGEAGLRREADEVAKALKQLSAQNAELVEALTYLQKEREGWVREGEALRGRVDGVESSNEVLKAAVTRLNLQKDELELRLHNM